MLKHKKRIIEGIDEEGSPDMKYYAFDWDDNIMTMPTKVRLKDEERKIVTIIARPTTTSHAATTMVKKAIT